MSWPALHGKAHIDRVLSGSVDLGRLHHAYLFEGPPATGKSYLATRAAAALLCKQKGMYGADRVPGSIAPCGDCRNCKRILSRNHPDLVWFDDFTVERSGSHVPVARLKQIPLEALNHLVSQLSRRPIEGDRRAVVIRRVERMNASAQNAFLKLLEEPPRGTLFLMTCANPHQLLATILSRCQRLPVRLLTAAQLAGALVAEGLPGDRAETIGNQAEGRIGVALAQAGLTPAAAHGLPPPDRQEGAAGIGTRSDCPGWLELLTPPQGIAQTGTFSGRILATIQEQLAAAPQDTVPAADDDEDDSAADENDDDDEPAAKLAAKTAKVAKNSAAKKSNITANEAQRLAAQKVVGDLAYTWHRAWQLAQGGGDCAGEPPLYPPPGARLVAHVHAVELNLAHGWFEEAVAALQYNVRTELVLKALAVRLAR